MALNTPLSELDIQDEKPATPETTLATPETPAPGTPETTEGDKPNTEATENKPDTEGDKPEAADEEENKDPLTFRKSVDTLRGEEIPVEYGDTDPNTPEGVLLREKTIESLAITKFEDTLAQIDPRGYAYLLHRSRGGTDEQFFEIKIPTLPEFDTFKNSVDLQSQVYKTDLLNKGVDSEEAEFIVQKAIKDGKLEAKATQVYQATQVRAQKQLDDIQKESERVEAEEKRSIAEFGNTLQSAIKSPNSKIVIPESDHAEFTKFMSSMIQKQGDKFYVVQEISKDNIDKITAANFLLYKKGDLGALVKRKAQTMFTQTIKSNVDKSKKIPTTNEQPKLSTPLSELY